MAAPQDPRTLQLAWWADRLAELGLMPSWARLSCRMPGGLLAVPETAPAGDEPLHLAVYRQRPDAQAVMHGYDAAALEHAGAMRLRVARAPDASATPGLIAEVCGLLSGQDYVLTRGYGFVAVGPSPDEAGELVRKVCRGARSI